MFIKLLNVRFIINLRIIIIYRSKIIFSSNLTGEFKTHFDPRGIYSNTFPLAIINTNHINHSFSLFYNTPKNTLYNSHYFFFFSSFYNTNKKKEEQLSLLLFFLLYHKLYYFSNQLLGLFQFKNLYI